MVQVADSFRELSNGELKLRQGPWLIFKRYLSRTIFLDLVTLVPDWVVTLSGYMMGPLVGWGCFGEEQTAVNVIR